MAHKSDMPWVARGYMTFKEWLDAEFLPDGGFITVYKKHAMSVAFRAGIREGAKMSKGEVKENNIEMHGYDKNSVVWL